MTLNLDIDGLKSVVNDFDLFFIDIWGVVHNGVKLFKDAVITLDNLERLNKEYVLLTNAPRPNLAVEKYLIKIGLDEKKTKKVYTSGEAALDYLLSELRNKKFFHIGSIKDFDLFKSFEKEKVKNLKEADYILCTGLFDDHEENLDFYKKLLTSNLKKKMVCTNPDLVVDRGEKREYCAGTIAGLFNEMGGEVEYFGKPYYKIYKQASNIKGKKILCIGDNINTDIKGANKQNYKSLLITNGIHKNEIQRHGIKNILIKYNIKVNYLQSNLKW